MQMLVTPQEGSSALGGSLGHALLLLKAATRTFLQNDCSHSDRRVIDHIGVSYSLQMIALGCILRGKAGNAAYESKHCVNVLVTFRAGRALDDKLQL